MSADLLSKKTILELAEDSGLFNLNPSDLVYESSHQGQSYYDYVLSCSDASTSTGSSVRQEKGYTLYLAKFDRSTNLESLECMRVPQEYFDDGLPENDIALMTLGVLTWKAQIARSRILCLVRSLDLTHTNFLDGLKRATDKFKCLHHVQSSRRRDSASSDSSFFSTSSTSRHGIRTEAMRLRIMFCQYKSVVENVPANALREAKAVLDPSSNYLLCLCFPLV